MTAAPQLVAITPGDHGRGRDLAPWIRALGRAGLRTLLIREPHLDDDALDALMLNAWGTVPDLVMHDRHPRARVYGLPIHLPAAGEVGSWLGPWSRSCHTAQEVQSALDSGAAWVTLSPVWRPLSKPEDNRPVLGIDGFISVAEGRSVVALGGLNAERAVQLANRQAAGIAVCGSLFGLEGPAQAASACTALLDALSD